MQSPKTIKVTVHKNHLITLGERMYVEAVELLRELVANAYDADATEVHIRTTSDSISVEDDGNGMNERGLEQYFNIGSDFKRRESLSPKFGRKRIGQFGIGKFAALAAADEFAVETRKGTWVYRVVFNKKEWDAHSDWELPIERREAGPFDHEGTRVVLTKLRKQFSQADIERHLKNTVPLRSKKFAVYVNNKPISARSIAGKTITFIQETVWGPIEGEFIVALNPRDIEQVGIECRVKQVLICYETFNLEGEWSASLHRVTGSVNADFLPVTSSRTDFIRDSAEWKLFLSVVGARLTALLRELKKQRDGRRTLRMQNELREVMNEIRQALERNPTLTPIGRVLAARKKRRQPAIVADTVAEPHTESEEVATETRTPEKQAEKPEIPSPTRAGSPRASVTRRMRVAKLGITVQIAPLGETAPEVTSDGNLVVVNEEHPLYITASREHGRLHHHLLRIITREVVLMKRLRLSAREAFDMQSKLLTDALTDT